MISEIQNLKSYVNTTLPQSGNPTIELLRELIVNYMETLIAALNVTGDKSTMHAMTLKTQIATTIANMKKLVTKVAEGYRTTKDGSNEFAGAAGFETVVHNVLDHLDKEVAKINSVTESASTGADASELWGAVHRLARQVDTLSQDPSARAGTLH